MCVATAKKTTVVVAS